ncbi:MAG: DNA-binding protein [Bacteroides sp.]|uniref:HU family DNA-binding protein n=1 Tax=Bacteroides sp. TaxID=29523 RepID=UPI0026E0C3ED|nr:DNA-binding protein [Bacteroides sp.]MDO5421376.1 DNA-binding protein [Bacteroides sp.]
MAIVFDWYENPNASEEEGEKGLHPRIFLNGKVDTDKLCSMIHARSSLTVGDAQSAISTLAKICSEELRDGRVVHIDGLGYFAPTLESTQRVTRSTSNKSAKLRLKTISFRPDIKLKAELAGISATQAKYTRHSAQLSEVEIDIRLKEYFAEHSIMVRYDFQELCGLTRATANRHLRRLQDEGKLKNVGRRTQPIYMPAPGYYGVSRDAVQER